MIRTLLLLSLLAPMARAQQTLASLIDKNRVLLVFAPSDHDLRYQQQLALLAHHAVEMKDRDLIVIPVLSQSGPPVTANTRRIMRGPGLSDPEQLLARHRFHVSPDAFNVILIGKDGGEKLSSAKPLSIETLRQTIDAMPMRQEELRNRKASADSPPSSH